MKSTMPVLFIGHGSPMNAVQDNEFTRSLRMISGTIPRPRLILVISAHWLTEGIAITASDHPSQIYDFYRFPDELYQIEYHPPGSPADAEHIIQIARIVPIALDDDWGIDHGAWSVLRHLYPAADIPVIQLSLDLHRSEAEHFAFAPALSSLREEGILIIGSGNIVHNLSIMSYKQFDPIPYDWALEFDRLVADRIRSHTEDTLVDYCGIGGAGASLVAPTNDHYLPLLYAAALRRDSDQAVFIHEGIQHKSISMRSFILSS